MRKFLFLLMALGFLLAALPAAAQDDNTIIIGIGPSPSFRPNPLWTTSSQNWRDQLTLPGLIQYDGAGQPILYLAESIEPNEDATVWTVKIRDEAVWSDGEPISAQDVKFTYELRTNPIMLQQPAGPAWPAEMAMIDGNAAYAAGEADEITGIRVVDDKTVEFAMTGGNSNFLWVTNGGPRSGILPSHILGDVDLETIIDHPYMTQPDVVSGPYTITEYVPDSFWRLERNENFWGTPANIDNVIFRIFEEDETRFAALEAGEIDVAAIQAVETQRFEELPTTRVIGGRGIGTYMLQLNIGGQSLNPVATGSCGPDTVFEYEERPPMSDQRVRQALAYAIDRQEIIDVIVNDYGTPVYAPIFGSKVDEELVETYEHNPERALELMAEAGWTLNEAGTRLVDANGELMRPLVFVAVAGQEGLELGLLLQDYFDDIGVLLDIKLVQAANLVPTLVGEEFDMFRNAGGRFGIDPSISTLYYSTCAGTAGWMGYSNPEFDALMRAGEQTIDTEERRELYNQAMMILNTELPIITIMSRDSIMAVNNRVQGPTGGAGDFLIWDITDWTLDSSS